MERRKMSDDEYADWVVDRIPQSVWDKMLEADARADELGLFYTEEEAFEKMNQILHDCERNFERSRKVV